MERSQRPLASPGDPTRLAQPLGAATPPRSEQRPDVSRRKQVLVQLLEALRELQDEDLGTSALPGRKNTALVDDRGEGPNVDEQMQAEGAKSFEVFQLRVLNLDRELRKFSNAITQLGSSVGLLSSSFRMRQRLSCILHLVRDNASELFPRKIRKESSAPAELLRGYFRGKRLAVSPNIARSSIIDEIDMEDFPQEIEGLAKDTINFLHCLNEFPGKSFIIAFEGDLKYWASCLSEFENQFRFPGVTRYVHDLSTEIGEHLENITGALIVFVEVGVPTIQLGQKHGARHVTNLSTVATFFSAVTATTIQFSFDRTERLLDNWVNALWYSSLVFSIASAVNSALGLAWQQASYRSPGHRVPWWITIWLIHSPLIFLIISVTTFSVGLCLFTYASGQPHMVSLLVTAFTACSSFGLFTVSSWFVFERFVYNKHKGKVWLADVLDDFNKRIRRVLGIEWATRVPPTHIKRVGSAVAQGSSKLVRSATRRFTVLLPTSTRDLNGHDAPSRMSGSETDLEAQSISDERKSPIPMASPVSPSTVTFAGRDSPMTAMAGSPEPQSPRTGTILLPGNPVELTTQESAPESAAARNHRLKTAVRSVMMLRSASGGRNSLPASAKGEASVVSIKHGSTGDRRMPTRKATLAPLTAGRLMRIASTRTELGQVTVAQVIPAHQALVRNLAFSPNGQYLATCSWDRTNAILRVSDLSSHRILAHPYGFVGQVMWSPDGSLLLTKLTSGINIWTEDGVCIKRIERRTAVHSMVWFANGQEFLSIETNEAVHLDVKGKILDRYPFDRLKLHDVAITKDGERLFAVATLEHSKDGYKPVKARAEKRIVVYNRLEKEIENQVPVLHDVRDITLSKDDKFALISYEHKAPPQLWQTDFAGPSYFAGKNDQIVFCASKGGDIHAWDRESGTLLHHFPPSMSDGDLTCIAWNNHSETHMFSTGSHDGTVRLWTANADGIRNSIVDHPAIIPGAPTDTARAFDSIDVSDFHIMTEEPEMLVESPTILTRQPLNAREAELGGPAIDEEDGYFTPHEPIYDQPEEPQTPLAESRPTHQRKRTISFSEPPARPE
ncbi:WD40 repeat-like protein [Auriculariales sp. MPI-PUGE-AT-0066]|nr:WD40 repeat-like protein [Auriculariales sp. MPI-PUGE-AT-0066]